MGRQILGEARRLWKLIVGFVIAGLLIAFFAYLGASGFRDPTEDFFRVTIKNDTAATVQLKQCDVRCN